MAAVAPGFLPGSWDFDNLLGGRFCFSFPMLPLRAGHVVTVGAQAQGAVGGVRAGAVLLGHTAHWGYPCSIWMY